MAFELHLPLEVYSHPLLSEILDELVKYRSVIETHNVRGPILQTFNYGLLTEYGEVPSLETLNNDIYQQQPFAFKTNVSCGFVLHNTRTDEVKFWYPSLGNATLFETPRRIDNRDAWETFIENLHEKDLLQAAMEQRPNTEWTVLLMTNVMLFVYSIVNEPLGRPDEAFPQHLINNRGVTSLVKNAGTGRPYTDNLCFWRCYALFKGHPVKGLETATKQYLAEFTDAPAERYKGMNLTHIDEFERCFGVNVTVFSAECEERTHLVRRSLGKYPRTMYLNQHETHFSYIHDLKKYSRCYSCPKCKRNFASKQLWRHVERCEGAKTSYRYKGGVYHPNPPLRKQFAQHGIDLPESLQFHPYRIAYDIETYFEGEPTADDHNGKLSFGQKHTPLSVSIASNVDGFEEPNCFVTNGDPNELCQRMLEYMIRIADQSTATLSEDAKPVFDEIDEKLEAIGQVDKAAKDHPLHGLKKKLESFIDTIPVIGFSSGRYDINVLKPYLLPHFDTKKSFTVKRANQFLILANERLRFLDVQAYLAPNFSYSDFLQAFGATSSKSFFPYEWMTNLEHLSYESLPPRDVWHSTLTGKTISEEDYAECQQIWTEKGMTSFRDWLVHYNNADVGPFMQALKNQNDFFRERDLDQFYDGISLAGLTLRYLFDVKDGDSYFTLFNEQQADIYQTMRHNLVGGPSIVFCRKHERDTTLLRVAEPEHFPHATCKRILAYDANSLYLKCLAGDMPVGYPGIRKEEDGFVLSRYRPQSQGCLEWLFHVEKNENIKIHHAGNGGREAVVGGLQKRVDGLCGDTVFEYHGCWYHGHNCHLMTGKKLTDAQIVEKREARENTIQKTNYLRSIGYKVREMWECEWQNQKCVDDIAVEAATTVSGTDTAAWIPGRMTSDIILELVKSDEMFGVVECDISTPEELKPKFREFCPVFKNTEVSRQDIGPFMRDYAEQNKVMTRPRRCLISSYKADKIMLSTPLLKYYLELGLQVTRIYSVIQYRRHTCFGSFADSVTEARRAADLDPNKAIIAQSMKLMGNSSYGKSIENVEKHRDVKVMAEAAAQKAINDPFFAALTPVGQDHYEVTFRKKVIRFNLPIQIGFFVYQYAKLRLLRFYYDFLDFYVARRDFECITCDTDSLFFAISGDSLESVVKPTLRDHFKKHVHEWLPSQTCVTHRDTPQQPPPPACCVDTNRYQNREPGLWKIEAEGDKIIALCSKTYVCSGKSKEKVSAKGVHKRINNVSYNRFNTTLESQTPATVTNRGFRLDRQGLMRTYVQRKTGLTYFYPKRKVLEDGISTAPLDI